MVIERESNHICFGSTDPSEKYDVRKLPQHGSVYVEGKVSFQQLTACTTGTVP